MLGLSSTRQNQQAAAARPPHTQTTVTAGEGAGARGWETRRGMRETWGLGKRGARNAGNAHTVRGGKRARFAATTRDLRARFATAGPSYTGNSRQTRQHAHPIRGKRAIAHKRLAMTALLTAPESQPPRRQSRAIHGRESSIGLQPVRVRITCVSPQLVGYRTPTTLTNAAGVLPLAGLGMDRDHAL